MIQLNSQVNKLGGLCGKGIPIYFSVSENMTVNC